MIGLGPVPMPIVLMVVALLVAAAAGRALARPATAAEPPVRVLPLFTDMLVVGLVAGRLAFIVQWWSLYREDPWAILRLGDGGYTIWVAVAAGLAFGAWRVRRHPALRRPLAGGALAGLATWAALAGSLWLLQQGRIPLPDTRLTRLEGGTVQLSSMTGRPMVVNLWATWCPPCRREMPVLADGQQLHPDVAFVFANQGEGPDLIRDYLAEGDMQLRNVLLDPFSAVSQATGARGLPTTLFFDAGGRLVDTHMGELTRAGLARKLQAFEASSRPHPPGDSD